jgi:hypothetical protein
VGLRLTARPGLPRAAEVLGPSHPIAQAAALQAVLRRQLAVVASLVAVAVVGVDLDGSRLGGLLAAALAVELCLAVGVMAARTCLHERARDVIADGGDQHVEEVAAECRRLADRRYRTVLATTLGRAVDDAERWDTLAIGTRPPPSVRNLAGHRATIDAVVALVSAPGAPVRAIALLDRLIRGGYAAPLYCGRADDVGRELGRIRTLLLGAPARPPDAAG